MFGDWAGGGWANSHSFRRAIALERISRGAVLLFSKVNWFLLIHKLQQTQAKMLADVPIGGRLTLEKEISRVFLNEVQDSGSIGSVHGHSSHTALAGAQEKKMCSKVSSAPHLVHRVLPSSPLLRKFSPVGRLFREQRQIKVFIFGSIFGDQTNLCQFQG